jgi:hypothetical protein
LFVFGCVARVEPQQIGEYLNSKLSNPTDTKKLATHKAVKGQLLNAIVQKLPAEVFLRHVKDNTPYKLWTKLKKEFGTVNIAALAAIKLQMFSLQCKPNGNMRKYLLRMLELKQQLAEAGTDANISNRRFCNATLTGAQSAGPSYVAIAESLILTYTATSKEADLTAMVVIMLLRTAYNSMRALWGNDSNSSAQANAAYLRNGNRNSNNGLGCGSSSGQG